MSCFVAHRFENSAIFLFLMKSVKDRLSFCALKTFHFRAQNQISIYNKICKSPNIYWIREVMIYIFFFYFGSFWDTFAYDSTVWYFFVKNVTSKQNFVGISQLHILFLFFCSTFNILKYTEKTQAAMHSEGNSYILA